MSDINSRVNNRPKGKPNRKLIFIVIDFLLIVGLSLLVFLGGLLNYCFQNKRQQSAVRKT